MNRRGYDHVDCSSRRPQPIYTYLCARGLHRSAMRLSPTKSASFVSPTQHAKRPPRIAPEVGVSEDLVNVLALAGNPSFDLRLLVRAQIRVLVGLVPLPKAHPWRTPFAVRCPGQLGLQWWLWLFLRSPFHVQVGDAQALHNFFARELGGQNLHDPRAHAIHRPRRRPDASVLKHVLHRRCHRTHLHAPTDVSGDAKNEPCSPVPARLDESVQSVARLSVPPRLGPRQRTIPCRERLSPGRACPVQSWCTIKKTENFGLP